MRRPGIALVLALGAGTLGSDARMQAGPGLPAALARANRATVGPVEAEMHNVVYHVDAKVSLVIRDLRGALLPTRPGQPPWFEDDSSFVIEIDSAVIGIAPASLSALMNDYVFDYPGAPITGLDIVIEKGELKQTGKLHGIPFTIRSGVSTTSDGRIRLHPRQVKVLGIPVTTIMHMLSVELDGLVRVRPGRGIAVAGNDFLLAPSSLLPPPQIRGRVSGVALGPSEVVLTFGGSHRAGRSARLGPAPGVTGNFMAFRGAILRFGKLTMVDADLRIVDGDPHDPFDFFLSKLDEQLVAGGVHAESDFGLISTMPDYDDMLKARK